MAVDIGKGVINKLCLKSIIKRCALALIACLLIDMTGVSCNSIATDICDSEKAIVDGRMSQSYNDRSVQKVDSADSVRNIDSFGTSSPDETSCPEESNKSASVNEFFTSVKGIYSLHHNKQSPEEKTIENKSLKKSLPILYYHAINDNITGLEELFVSPSEFDRQMQYLKQNNYDAISFAQLKYISKIPKPVIITFDDGYEDNYRYAYPILKKYGFTATIFICSDVIDKPLFLKTVQIQEMKDFISFQSHTVSHRRLSELKDDEIEYELRESKKAIEEITGCKIDVLAYPYGDYNVKVINIAKKYYNYAVVSGGGLYHEGDNNYEIKRVYVPRDLNIDSFIKKLKGQPDK